MSDLCRWSSAQLRQALDVGLVKQVEAEKGEELHPIALTVAWVELLHAATVCKSSTAEVIAPHQILTSAVHLSDESYGEINAGCNPT